MSEKQKSAIIWAIGELVWLCVAAWNFWCHQMLVGVLALIAGWLWGSMNIYLDGFDDGVDACYEDADELMEHLKVMQHRLTKMWERVGVAAKKLEEADEPFAAPTSVCPKCGNEDFQVVAGHFVCTCCGSVLEKDHGKDQVP